MIKFIKKVFAFFTFLIMLCTSPVISFAGTSPIKSNEITINLELSTNEEDAYSNFLRIEEALVQSDGSNMIHVVFPKGQMIYITTSGTPEEPNRALRIRSNTIIDLNGSTLIRTGASVNQNIFQNCDLNGERNDGGYTLSENITIQNGTLDGNGSKSTNGLNLVNLGHAQNINITNVQFKNVFEGHMLELSGCSDVVIENCTFDGFYGDATKENIEAEALQIDIALSGWNGVYKSDATVCRNITINKCTFLNNPSAIGNHHTLVGCHNQNINITGNTCRNTREFGDNAAIWCYAFDDCTVKGNVIEGKYGKGIMVSAGSDVTVSNNSIDLSLKENSYGIYATKAGSYINNKNEEPTERTEEFADKIIINDNTIKNYGENGIFAASQCAVNAINNNTVANGSGDGIYVTGASVDTVSGNTVSGCKAGTDASAAGECVSADGCGIHFASTAVVTAINDNIIKNYSKNGIYVASQNKVNTINNNTVENGSGDGIYVTGATVASIAGNTVSGISAGAHASADGTCVSSDGCGIHLSSTAVASAVNNNEIRNYGKNGIYVASKGNINTINNNTVESGSGDGIYVTGATVGSITGNTVSFCKAGTHTSANGACVSSDGCGIHLSSTAVASAVNNNEIRNYGKNGIYVASKGNINTINNNTVANGSGDGIYVTGATVASITGNTVSGSEAGAHASADGKCTSSDGCGIHLSSTANVKACEKNTISNCGGEELKWTHTYGDWVIVKAATCSSVGKKERTCTLCGKKDSAEIKKTSHKAVTDKAVAATCTKAGKTAGSHCSVCNTVIKAQQTVPATGHSYDEGKITKAATCTANGVKTYTCTKCKATKTEAIKATGHKAVTDKAVAATCTKAGKTAGSHCSVCNAVITAQKTVPATGHSYDTGKVTKQPTATTAGVKTYTCTKCKATKTETIKATGLKTPVLKAAVNANGTIKLSWGKVAEAEKYELYIKQADGSYKLMKTTNATSFTTAFATYGKQFTYKMRAVTSNTKSAYSAAVNATNNKKLQTPTLKVAVNSNGTFKLSWNKVAGATSYQLYIKQADGSYKLMKTTNATSFTTAFATYGKQFTYKMRAVTSKNSSATSAYSSAVNATNNKKLQTPTMKVTVNANGTFKLSWNAVAGATSYQLYIKQADGSYKLMKTTNATSFTTAFATYGKQFTYKMRAVTSKNSSATSAYSSAVNTKNTKKLQTPTLKVAVNKNGSFKLSWGKVTGATSYQIYMKQSNGSYKLIKTTTSTSFTTAVAAKGKTYSYKVRAVTSKNKNATSNYSNVVSAKRK